MVLAWIAAPSVPAPRPRPSDSLPTGEQWANIGVTGLFRLVIPVLVGLGLVMRSEVE